MTIRCTHLTRPCCRVFLNLVNVFFLFDLYEVVHNKCAVGNVKRGEVQGVEGGLQLIRGAFIQDLEILRPRVYKICRSVLSSRNKNTAINSRAIRVAAYTFGLVKWLDMALEAFDRKMRTVLTKHRMYLTCSSVERLYLN